MCMYVCILQNIFLIQRLPLEYLFMKTYGKAMEPSSKTSSNTNTICHAGIKDSPYEKTRGG